MLISYQLDSKAPYLSHSYKQIISVYSITLSWSLSLTILFFLLSLLIIPSLDWKTPYLTHSSKQIILCLFHHTTVLQPSLITYIYWLFNGEGDQLTVRSSEATPSSRQAFCPPGHEWLHHKIELCMEVVSTDVNFVCYLLMFNTFNFQIIEHCGLHDNIFLYWIWITCNVYLEIRWCYFIIKTQ